MDRFLAGAFGFTGCQVCPGQCEVIEGFAPYPVCRAGFEGLLLFVILALAIRAGALARSGRVFGIFLVGYALARVFLEDFRQADAQFVTPDNPHGHVLIGLTMGQLLSLPMLAVGLLLIARSARRA